MREHEALVGQYLPSRPVGAEASLVEYDHARAQIENQFEIVAGDNLGRGALFQNFDQPAPRAGVEIARRFVKRQEIGFAGQYAGQRDAAAFAEAQFARRPVFEASQPYGSQRLAHPASHLVLREPQIERPKRHILEHRRTEELIVRILKQKPHDPPNLAEVRSDDRHSQHFDRMRRLRHARDVGAVRSGGPTFRDAAGSSREQAVEVQQQRGLSGPIRPDDSDSFPDADRKAHVRQRQPAVGVMIRQMFDLQNRDGSVRHGWVASVDAIKELAGCDRRACNGEEVRQSSARR